MLRKLFPAVVLGMILGNPAAALADGTMGVPAGTKITSLPYTISTPGAYYLANNLSAGVSSFGIMIESDHVTLDLMGYTLACPGHPGFGISMNGRTNVEIRNGTLTGWAYGVLEEGSGFFHRIINVRSTASFDAINLGGTGHQIRGCQATSTGSGSAIAFGGVATVSDCRVNCHTGWGINAGGGGKIIGNVVTGPGSGSSTGIYVASGAVLVKDNKVNKCDTGIKCMDAASLIGNTVSANNGIIVNGTSYPILLDQNLSSSVTASGTGIATRLNNVAPNGKF